LGLSGRKKLRDAAPGRGQGLSKHPKKNPNQRKKKPHQKHWVGAQCPKITGKGPRKKKDAIQRISFLITLERLVNKNGKKRIGSIKISTLPIRGGIRKYLFGWFTENLGQETFISRVSTTRREGLEGVSRGVLKNILAEFSNTGK